MKTYLTLMLMLIIGILPIYSNTLFVPGQYHTIQSGIDASQNGDTVLVADGVYTGEGNKNLSFYSKSIWVLSENGPENCIIDCENEAQSRGAYFHHNEDSTTVFGGFTITHGNYWSGGGIYCIQSDPKIVNCHLIDNNATPD